MKETWQQRFDSKVLKTGAIVLLCAALLSLLLFWIVQDSWQDSAIETEAVAPGMQLTWLHNGDTVEQGFSLDYEQLRNVTLFPIINGAALPGQLHLEIADGDETYLSREIPLAEMLNQVYYTVDFMDMTTGKYVSLPKGRVLTLRLTLESEAVSAFSLGYGDSISVGKFDVAATGLDSLTVNGATIHGRLSYQMEAHSVNSITVPYFGAVAAILLCLALLTLLLAWKRAHGKRSFLLIAVEECIHFRFLINQLVARDFNTKYRHSLLGAMWSFLNPLLTMAVQYVVFNTLFRSNIPNFPVYLMTGIVLFNFFSESVGLGLDSVVNGASLITKVYMPKYIFPISRVLSSLVNLMISFIPLLLMMLVTGVHLSRALLLLPFLVLTLTLFCIGMSFILATANVFFRDTRFLWGVLVLMWNYLTPVFYPESIIPTSMIRLYHMNPMYQYIYFLRCITLGNVTPQPITYVYCILCALIPLLLGFWIFRRNQSRFILYL